MAWYSNGDGSSGEGVDLIGRGPRRRVDDAGLIQMMRRDLPKIGIVPNHNHVHRYERVDRGLEHVHRWRAACSCGWIGKNHRRSKYAKSEFLTVHRNRQRGTGVTPRTPTPRHLLPERLR